MHMGDMKCVIVFFWQLLEPQLVRYRYGTAPHVYPTQIAHIRVADVGVTSVVGTLF